ncbi:pH-sensitive chloride channel 1 isoform X3 [Musca autumnalis]|uniref:pH-sensitive chloride channel 1 isoform X3 n=1 Tax=Musca autumnalis TaxID=221902 RepID=UPI003CFA5D5B
MGCSFETAIQTSGINETFDKACYATTIVEPAHRTRNFYAKESTKTLVPGNNNCITNNNSINNTTTNTTNNSICNHNNPTKQDKTNDDCQQQQKPAKAKNTTTTNITPTTTTPNVNESGNNDGIIRDDSVVRANFYNLEVKENINKNSRSRTQHLLVEQETETLQESCPNCYPLTCQHRICCRQQNLFVSEIATQTRFCLDYSDYFSTNCCNNSINNCNSNSSCSSLVSSYVCQKHKNTFRHECHDGKHAYRDRTSDAVCKRPDSFSTNCSTGRKCLQNTLSQASVALTSNALDLKNSLAEVIGNCATMVETLLRSDAEQCTKHCKAHSSSNSSNYVNNNNNNKSEPYRGYCQRKQGSKPEHIPYTSTNSSRSLHDNISSKYHHQHYQCSQQQCSNKVSITSNCNNNNSTTNSRSSCSNCHAASRASSTQTAAFNYIGHNYYHFLRNSINFYTAYTASIILVLCYLTTTTSAATPKSDATSLDKHPIFDESSSDKEILDLLLEQKRYDKRLLPPVHDEDFCCGLSSPDMATEQNSRRPHKRGTLNVNVTVLLLSLASPDESSLKYEVEFLLNQFWVDPRLQYGNKSHYDFLNALHHHDSIWTPDTYFSMHGDFKDPIIPMHFALRIFRNGTIMYSMRRHLILSCQGSLHIFPFDDPKCTFSMESISYEEPQIRYVWTNGEVTLLKSPSLTTLNAYLIKNQTTACDQHSWRGNYSCLRVDLIFTRDRAFYFTTVFIPGIILVTSSFITFWLEWNAVPARSMIGVTTMLNFFTTSNGFRSTLPVVSNLTAMNVWDGVCMCFIYASLLEFVCVNYMGRKRPQHNVVYRPGENPVTQRLPAVLSRIGVILASPLEIIEREFNAAMSEKAATGLSSTGTSSMATPRPGSPHSEYSTGTEYQRQHSGGIIASAVQNLRSRSIKRRNVKADDWKQPQISADQDVSVYEHIYTEPGGVTTFSAVPNIKTTAVTIETDITDDVIEIPKLRRTQSMSTNTPPLICKGTETEDISGQEPIRKVGFAPETKQTEPESMQQLGMPVKPPRRKSSRSTSPSSRTYDALQGQAQVPPTSAYNGEKKRDTGGPNEIVACTTCGGNSGTPCTHSANNGCATETCFVQVRKKEPPHPIRIAKTIDVIARITFPTAYAIFLIFFFVHYKGFS